MKRFSIFLLALLSIPAMALAQVDPIGQLYGGYVANPGPTSSPAYKLEMNKLTAAGQNDSHSVEWTGRSYDTAVHQSDWRAFVDVTSNAGASTYEVQSRIDGNAFTSRFSVTDGGNVTVPGTLAVTGQITGPRTVTVVSAASGTTALTASQSGALVANTGTTGTTTFTLPSAAAGYSFCFVEAGDAGGELLINPATGDAIVGKTHGAENGTGIAPAAGTGIKNTAATNVKGDFTCLQSLDATTWLMTSVAGVWASQ